MYITQLHKDLLDILFLFLLLTFVGIRDLSYNQLTGKIPFNIGFLQVATLYEIILFVKILMKMLCFLLLYLSRNCS